MKSSTCKALLSIVLGIFVILAANYSVAASVSWRSYSSNVFASAKQQNKLVLLYVNSETCHWCKLMNDESFQSPQIINVISKKFIPVSVNIVSDHSIADSYSAYATPTFIILDGNKNKVSRLDGYQSPDAFLSYLQGF